MTLLVVLKLLRVHTFLRFTFLAPEGCLMSQKGGQFDLAPTAYTFPHCVQARVSLTLHPPHIPSLTVCRRGSA